MSILNSTKSPESRYAGLRMSADEYLALSEDGCRYELIDGVVCMSPSPFFSHQKIAAEIARQIGNHLVTQPIGMVAIEIDVRLRDDLIYRPDLVYLSNEKAARCHDHITEIPDLVVEITSPSSRQYDSRTKRGDYEAAGIPEFWLIDPQAQSCTFLVLKNGRYEAAPSSPDHYDSSILPGFQLMLGAIRRHF